MPDVIVPKDLAAGLSELWSPRVIGELDDNYVKVAKVQGSLPWHSHEHEDELFLVLSGRLRLDMEAGAVELGAGEMFIMPKGVRHQPIAVDECLLLLIERKSTQHTGDVVSPQTRSLADQLRPV